LILLFVLAPFFLTLSLLSNF